MATWRASPRASATLRRTCPPPAPASSDTLLGLEKQWSRADTRASTRLPRWVHARSNASPYSSWGSRPSTLRQTRSTVSTLTRREAPSLQAACTERTSLASALEPASCSSSSAPCSAARAFRAARSGAAGSLERGSARSSGLQRCVPVAGSRPRNMAWTCSGVASPTSLLVAAASPTNRPGDSPLPEKYSSRFLAIWSNQYDSWPALSAFTGSATCVLSPPTVLGLHRRCGWVVLLKGGEKSVRDTATAERHVVVIGFWWALRFGRIRACVERLSA